MVHKKIFLGMSIFFFLLLFSTSFADTGKACISYFYGQGCEGCAELSSFIKGVEMKYPQLQVQKYEVYYRPKHMGLVQKHFAAYSVPEESQGLPVVFTPTTYLVGKKPIFDFLEQQIKESSRSDCPSVSAEKEMKIPGIVSDHFPLDIFATLSFQIITGGALRDAIRPGMIALSMLLLMLLTTLPFTLLVLRRGLQFVAVVFGVHFLFAVGLLMHLSASSLAILFYRLVGWIGILFGAGVVFAFFWGKRIHFLTSEGKKKIYDAQLEIVSALGFFLLSFIGGLLSFAHLSTTFLVLPHAFRGDSGWAALPIVLYYLLIVCLPLLLIVLIITRIRHYFDVQAEHKLIKVESWKEHYRKLVQLVVAVIIFVLGLLVLFW